MPDGVKARAEPRRLPLLGFPGLPPMQAPADLGGGGGGPLTPDDLFLCGLICRCMDAPSGRRQACVRRDLRAIEEASGHTSTFKNEVRYDMSKKPPAPIMSHNDPRRSTRGNPKGNRAPDVVVVRDGNKPPTQDNLKEVVEIKFPPDRLRDGQETAYKRIAGKNALFQVLGPKKCGCPEREEQEKKPVDMTDVLLASALVMAIVLMAADDAVGGVADDVLIPLELAELGGLLERLLPLLTF